MTIRKMVLCFSIMKRSIQKEFAAWKVAPERKPLVLKGTRQVGKTWALHEFGKSQYERQGYKYHYIDLRESREFHSIFAETFDPHRIIQLLEFRLKRKFDTANDLLVLDEIQECQHAITSLKYFEQDLKELDLIVAGSHIGLLKNEESFPVGKVDFLHMFPMNFEEFVLAMDPDAFVFLESYNCREKFPTIVHERLLKLLTCYLFIGGLPEAVAIGHNNGIDNISNFISDIRRVQENLILGYRSDFAKYSGVVNATHINYVFDSLPKQLSQTHDESVKKYKFRQVIPNRKGFDSIAGPLSWLLESRLCIRSSIARRAEHPVQSYCASNRFKLFLFDIGLLSCMLKLPGEVILGKNISSYKGFILENFVAQELYSITNKELISWQQGTAELEFLLANTADIIPVEVKSSPRHRTAKSLDAYINRYAPKHAFKMTMQNFSYNKKRHITTLPVYCSYKLPDILNP